MGCNDKIEEHCPKTKVEKVQCSIFPRYQDIECRFLILQPMQVIKNITESFNSRGKTLKYLGLFTIFFWVTFLIYLPALHSKFVFDFINLVFDIQNRPGLTEFSKGIAFDFVARLVFQTWLQWFGFNAWAWHFLQCFLHSVNAVLLYALLGFILNHFKYAGFNRIALLSAFCFLLSPYHTEPLVWGGDLNYLLVTSFILTHLLAFVFFMQNRKKRYLLMAVLALAAGFFTHELGWFMLPADFILVIALAPSFSAIFSKSNISYYAISLGIIILYFVNKAFSGQLLGHYGSAVHLRFHLTEIIPAFYKYLVKIIFLGGFLPTTFLDKLYGWMGTTAGVYALVITTVIVAFLLFKYLKKSPGLKAPVCFFLLFTLFVFPVLNLYFPYWIKIHGDRYCYITSAFLLATCITLLDAVRPVFSVAFSFLYLICSVFFLSYNIQSWHQAGDLSRKLEKDYRWQNAKHVYILNLPDNYRGAYMYRSLQPSAFAASFIKYRTPAPDGNRITEVLAYNLNLPTDSVNIQITEKDKLAVTLSAWGIWWWRQTMGASSYENNLVEVHPDELNHAYTVKFKQRQPGDVFLYCANGHWHEVPGF